MAYKIKILVSGIKFHNVIEDGEIISRKFSRGEVAVVEEVSEKDLASKMYGIIEKVEHSRIIIPESVKKEILPQQELIPAPTDKSNVAKLETLVSSLEAILVVAKDTLTEISTPEIKVIPDKKTVAVNKKEDLVEKYLINEEEELEDVYSHEDYKKNQEQVNKLINATINSGNTGDRSIVFKNSIKKMPTASEAISGKIIDNLIYDANGNPVGASKIAESIIVRGS